MGKKKGFNAKARQSSSQSIEDLQSKADKLEKIVDFVDVEQYKQTNDETNVLILEKKGGKAKKPAIKSTKKQLTNKQKKKLQKIVELKKKKEQRAEILASLASVQVTPAELALYKSTAKLGQTETPKLKRNAEEDEAEDGIINATTKRKRKRKKTAEVSKTEKPTPEVIFREESSDNSSSESENESNETEQDDTSEIINNDSEKEAPGENNTMKEIGSCDNEPVEIAKIVDIYSSTHEVKAARETEISSNEATQDKTIQTQVNKNVSVKNDKEMLTNGKHKKEMKPIHVEVVRTPTIQAARLLLPIIAEEQMVMETINENDVVIICGSTGSGKTTQVPQFLYEAGYATHSSRSGMIGITEPRRVAASSMSKRVAQEMNLPSSRVSYQIRYEGNVTDNTAIKFMTDGVLLKEMETDFLLSKYSALIIDEAHERSVFTDILIGLLSRVVPMRNKQGNPIKLIIMSATLRVEDFTSNTRLFPSPPPTLKIDARQYPVTVHFNKRTHEDYVTEAYRKACKIHRTLKNDGAILVFLTGQNEVLALCRKLRKTFSLNNNNSKPRVKKTKTSKGEGKGETLPTVDLDSYSTQPIEEDDVEFEQYEEYGVEDELITDEDECKTPLHVLPLYSVLSSDKQALVFEPPPDGSRLCVVATNVAETSLTIPDVKYIVDCGKVKRKFYDKVTGVSTFRITWTSKASADQRTGRAGRVGPGHCYRLYSSAVFQNDFEDFSEAEIQRRPVEDLLLQMKSMCIDKVVNFPFPSPPDSTALIAGEKLLLNMGALKVEKAKKGDTIAVITPLGQQMSRIPVSPRFAKMILLSVKQEGCLPFVVAIVAALTVKEVFTDDIDLSSQADVDNEDIAKKKQLITIARRQWAGDGTSALLGDMMMILRAVGACEYQGCSEKFCRESGLRHKAMLEVRKLRAQLTNAVNGLDECKSLFVDPKMAPPTNEQATAIRKTILNCFGDRVARKIPAEEARSLKIKNAYRCCSSDDPVYIHPTSSLFNKLPEYIVYQEVAETSKLYMKSCIAIEDKWLPTQAPYMCAFTRPVENVEPVFQDGVVQCHMACTYGPHVWQIAPQLVTHPDTPDKYRWFARFILEGKVVARLQEFSEHLLTPASVMVKSWAHLQPKTEKLFAALVGKEVDTRKKLRRVWKENKTYLLKEYLLWIVQSKHDDVRAAWPPIG